MGYKGVICYDLKTKKCIISRHVIHDETIFPFKRNSQHTIREQMVQYQSGISQILGPIPVLKLQLVLFLKIL